MRKRFFRWVYSQILNATCKAPYHDEQANSENGCAYCGYSNGKNLPRNVDSNYLMLDSLRYNR